MICAFCRRIILGQYENCVPTTSWAVQITPAEHEVPGYTIFVSQDHLTDASSDPFATGKVFEAATEYGKAQGVPYVLSVSVATQANPTSHQHLYVHYIPELPA